MSSRPDIVNLVTPMSAKIKNLVIPFNATWVLKILLDFGSWWVVARLPGVSGIGDINKMVRLIRQPV